MIDGMNKIFLICGYTSMVPVFYMMTLVLGLSLSISGFEGKWIEIII